jgi:hypothetical protein
MILKFYACEGSDDHAHAKKSALFASRKKYNQKNGMNSLNAQTLEANSDLL